MNIAEHTDIVVANAVPFAELAKSETSETESASVIDGIRRIAGQLVPYMDVLRLALIGRSANPADSVSSERVLARTCALAKKIEYALRETERLMGCVADGAFPHVSGMLGDEVNPMLAQRGLPTMDEILESAECAERGGRSDG